MSKEQKEAIALIFILTAVIVSACLMLIIKPRMKAVAENKKSLMETNVDIAKTRKLSKELLKLVENKDTLSKSIQENEAGLFGGITVGDLSRVVNRIVRSDFKSLRLGYRDDNVQRLPGGRYTELSNRFTIKNCNFQDVLRFVNALEKANPGIRITGLAIEDSATTPEERGRVTVGFDIKMVGLFEGEGVAADWQPDDVAPYGSADQRNPFGPIKSTLVSDPAQTLMDRIHNMKVTMVTSDSIWIKDLSRENSGARECLLRRYMPVFKPDKIGLIEIQDKYFTVLCPDGKKYRIFVRQLNEKINGETLEQGTIKDIIEIKP